MIILVEFIDCFEICLSAFSQICQATLANLLFAAKEGNGKTSFSKEMVRKILLS